MRKRPKRAKSYPFTAIIRLPQLTLTNPAWTEIGVDTDEDANLVPFLISTNLFIEVIILMTYLFIFTNLNLTQTIQKGVLSVLEFQYSGNTLA